MYHMTERTQWVLPMSPDVLVDELIKPELAGERIHCCLGSNPAGQSPENNFPSNKKSCVFFNPFMCCRDFVNSY